MTTVLEDAEATRALGARIGALLEPGDVVILDGPLGAGKTTFAQGVGEALGVPTPVRSPTYTIADLHSGGRVPFVHIDAYRLGSAAELDDIDLPLDGAVTLVEWGVGRAEHLADAYLVVHLDRPEGTDVRTCVIDVVGRGTLIDRFAAAGMA
ncbi:MAG TPA: tRNA (adenosine(37)-N6)-threonylcarbamoyltransferase complex ATPase subunit type 1 TsaE [Mycobacteriales bacterium]|nr:tRNA (adenosine(37)-N6)-threonylcarbamoyltransferase complex ATPase subunit type 1 TsaE [Mycobacteriales bacterium]